MTLNARGEDIPDPFADAGPGVPVTVPASNPTSPPPYTGNAPAASSASSVPRGVGSASDSSPWIFARSSVDAFALAPPSGGQPSPQSPPSQGGSPTPPTSGPSGAGSDPGPYNPAGTPPPGVSDPTPVTTGPAGVTPNQDLTDKLLNLLPGLFGGGTNYAPTGGGGGGGYAPTSLPGDSASPDTSGAASAPSSTTIWIIRAALVAAVGYGIYRWRKSRKAKAA